MVPYLVLAMFPIAFASIYNIGNTRGVNYSDETKKSFLVVCGIVLFIMIALRSKYNGSTDSLIYYNNWQNISTMTFGEITAYMKSYPMEDGYLFSVWLLSCFFSNPQFVFVFSGVLFAVAVCRFVYKNCEDVVIGFFMYITLGLYIFMVQGLRQAVAMSICLFAVEFAKRKKFFLFLIVVLLASLFHSSAIVFLIVYFIYGMKMEGKGYIIGGLLFSAIILFGSTLVDIANEQFNEDYSGAAEDGGYIAVAIYVIILLVAIIFGRDKKKDKDFSFFFFLTLLGLATYILRYTEVVIAERISYYFAFGQMALLPAVLQSFSKKEQLYVKILLVVLCVLLFVYRTSPLAPYMFFWQE